jgi:sporulation protein YlmC with PRC-barrel domain
MNQALSHSPVLSSSTISGDKVVNSRGEDLGEIKDLMIDVDSGRVAYAVLEAKAEYVKAKSLAKVEEKSAKSQAEATEGQMKAEYKAEKEKCDALSGNAKDKCISDAKMKYRQ